MAGGEKGVQAETYTPTLGGAPEIQKAKLTST